MTQRAAKSTRRELLQRSAAAAGMLAIPTFIPSSALGLDGATPPSSRLNIGLIGRGAMGSGHLRRLVGDPGIHVPAACEVDRQRLELARATWESAYGASRPSGSYRGLATYNDYRELLARPDVDAVVVVTPDHWHALQAIDAAKAGKDVYCEKPISVTIEEGRQLVQTVRRHGCIFQTGTQYRSIPTIRRICQFVRDGGLGKVRSVFTLLDPLGTFTRAERYRPYSTVLTEEVARQYAPIDFPLPPEPVPQGLDWQMWLGPAPEYPFNAAYHANPSPGVVPWSFSAAFGVAALTWHLAHSADVIQYALGVERSGPVELIHPSSGQFPTLTCRYASGTLLHFVDHWGMVKDAYHALPASARLAGNFGGIFIGERGWITSMSTGGPVEGGPEEIFSELALPTREVVIGANDHHANWFECIRTRKVTHCDEEIGHRTASVGHLAMIAYRLGRSLKWDPEKEEFGGDEIANRLRSRAMREPWRM